MIRLERERGNGTDIIRYNSLNRVYQATDSEWYQRSDCLLRSPDTL